MTQAMETGEVGGLLRYWRGVRRKSQLEVSFDTGISQKHLSFIESGRSVPGREVLIGIAEALDVPLRERNALFLAAGYAPFYAEVAIDAPGMAPVRKAMRRMLRQHDPYPALVLDRHWNVVDANDSAPRLFNLFTDLSRRPRPRNLLHLVFDPAGLRPAIANWEQLAPTLIGRLYRESVARVLDAPGMQLLDALLAYPGVRPEWKYPGRDAAVTPPEHPVVPISLRWKAQRLEYFSLVTSVGAPLTVGGQELRIESMFPADEATERLHAELFGAD